MRRSALTFNAAQPFTVGCVGDDSVLNQLNASDLPRQCDLIEIRLDALKRPIEELRANWRRLSLPLLFTARRGDEGGHGSHDANARRTLLEAAWGDASAIDIEVASAPELAEVIELAHQEKIPVILSSHDFEKTPDLPSLLETISRARDLGATVAKIAARLHSIDDLARLAGLLREDHGVPLSLMGMGPMAPASRLLLAQLGSVLNYGYLGATPTAPGQWSAARLKEAIASVEAIPRVL